MRLSVARRTVRLRAPHEAPHRRGGEVRRLAVAHGHSAARHENESRVGQAFVGQPRLEELERASRAGSCRRSEVVTVLDGRLLVAWPKGEAEPALYASSVAS